MVHVICDKCGKDCGRIAHFITVKVISNYASYNTDTGNKIMGIEDGEMIMSYCQDCYADLGFPNIYDVMMRKTK